MINEIILRGTQIRQREEVFKETKLLYIFDMGILDVDFLRELVQSRDEQQKHLLQNQILTHAAQMEAVIQYPIQRLFIVPNNTKNVIVNQINYVKYCKLLNNKLKDRLSILEYYLDHSDQLSYFEGIDQLNWNKPRLVTYLDYRGNVADQIVLETNTKNYIR